MMVGVKKSKEQEKRELKRAVFDRFASSDKNGRTLLAQENWNCDCRGGVVRSGVGLVALDTGDGREVFINVTTEVSAVFSTWLSGTEFAVYALGVDGYLYRINLANGQMMRRVQVGAHAVHSVMRDEDGLEYQIFSGDKAAYMTTGGDDFSQISTGNFIGSCVVGKRLLLAQERIIFYSEPLRPNILEGDSDSGGSLVLPAGQGCIVGLCADGGKAYVFTEKGIFSLCIPAKGREALFQKLSYSGGRICNRAMVATGNGILFLAENGLYRVLDGKVTRVCSLFPLSPADPNAVCKVGVCGDLAIFEYAELTSSGGTQERRVAIDFEGKEGFFIDRYGVLSGNELCYANSGAYRLACSKAGTIYQRIPMFQSYALDFGSNRRKYLRKICARGLGSVRVDILSEGITHTYSLQFVGGEAAAPLCEVGASFILRIFPSGGGELCALTVEYFE